MCNNYHNLISRSSSNEILTTQIDVFEESSSTDSEELESGGFDLQSHEDMFRVIYEKVCRVTIKEQHF